MRGERETCAGMTEESKDDLAGDTEQRREDEEEDEEDDDLVSLTKTD